MKKQAQTSQKQRHIRPQLAGLIISLACIIALFFLIGGAFAASGISIPSQKLQRLQLLDQQITQARAHAKPKNLKNLVSPPSQAIVTPTAGITQTHQAP